MDFKQDVIIDESQLDVEWLEQPRLMGKYTELSAKKKRTLDKEEEKLSVLKAELDMAIRKDPDSFGIVKVTEGSIMAAITVDEEYRNALNQVIDARFEYNNANGAVKAIEHRKTSLENLVKLHGQSYFAGPAVPHNLEELANTRRKEANKKVNLKRKKR